MVPHCRGLANGFLRRHSRAATDVPIAKWVPLPRPILHRLPVHLSKSFPPGPPLTSARSPSMARQPAGGNCTGGARTTKVKSSLDVCAVLANSTDPLQPNDVQVIYGSRIDCDPRGAVDGGGGGRGRLRFMPSSPANLASYPRGRYTRCHATGLVLTHNERRDAHPIHPAWKGRFSCARSKVPEKSLSLII